MDLKLGVADFTQPRSSNPIATPHLLFNNASFRTPISFGRAGSHKVTCAAQPQQLRISRV